MNTFYEDSDYYKNDNCELFDEYWSTLSKKSLKEKIHEITIKLDELKNDPLIKPIDYRYKISDLALAKKYTFYSDLEFVLSQLEKIEHNEKPYPIMHAIKSIGERSQKLIDIILSEYNKTKY